MMLQHEQEQGAGSGEVIRGVRCRVEQMATRFVWVARRRVIHLMLKCEAKRRVI